MCRITKPYKWQSVTFEKVMLSAASGRSAHANVYGGEADWTRFCEVMMGILLVNLLKWIQQFMMDIRTKLMLLRMDEVAGIFERKMCLKVVCSDSVLLVTRVICITVLTLKGVYISKINKRMPTLLKYKMR